MKPPCEERNSKRKLTGDILTVYSINTVLIPTEQIFPTGKNHWRSGILTMPFDLVSITRSMPSQHPRRPPETPSSWPPRPALTGLSPTCVAGRVGSFSECACSIPFRHRVVAPVVMSLSSSPMPSSSFPRVVGVVHDFGKCGPYILKRPVNTIKLNHNKI